MPKLPDDLPPLAPWDDDFSAYADEVAPPAQYLHIAEPGEEPEESGPRTLRGETERPDDMILRTRLLRRKTMQGADGGLIAHVANVITILAEDPRWSECLAYDELLRQVVWRDSVLGKWEEIPASAAANISMWIARVYGLAVTTGIVEDALGAVAWERRFSPVRDYMQSLKWDGTYRLGGEQVQGWLSRYLGAEDDQLRRAYGKLWMVGAAQRVLYPGSQNDHTLVLQGGQGVGKTTTARILARCGSVLSPRALRSFPSDLGNKDALLAATSAFLLEIGEMDAMRRSEVTALKDYLTQTHDTFRPAYGRREQTVPRACSFIGTVNDKRFLKDHTGSRRFWICEVKGLDRAALERDVDQLWAEAVYLVNLGVKPVLSQEMETLRQAETGEYEIGDPWMSAIASWISANIGANPSILDIAEHACNKPRGQIDQRDAVRIGQIMASLGWESYRARDSSVTAGKVTRYRRVSA